MKLLILFISTIAFISNTSFAQLSARYTLDHFNKDMDCEICFSKNGHYYITLCESITNDIVETKLFSDGSYIQKSTEVSLIDQFHGYKLLLRKNNRNELLVIKGFNWLINKRFVFFDNSESSAKSIFPKLNPDSVLQERLAFKRLNKTLNTLYSGLYDNRKGSTLYIQTDKKYKLMFKDIIFSEGAWSRYGNELILVDAALKHPFYAMIGKNILISKLLPANYAGDTFYRYYGPKIPGEESINDK
jgi:hypothetical protein